MAAPSFLEHFLHMVSETLFALTSPTSPPALFPVFAGSLATSPVFKRQKVPWAQSMDHIFFHVHQGFSLGAMILPSEATWLCAKTFLVFTIREELATCI